MALDLIYLLVGVPFLGAILVAFGGQGRERFISNTATIVAGSFALLDVCLTAIWFLNGSRHIDLRPFNLYVSGRYTFQIAFFIDSMSITFLGLIAFLTNIVVHYSRYYMHREPSHQKFFAGLLFLMFGLTLLTVAGTLDLLMAGWEFVGISSFVLISFYQNRLNPVRNAFKVLSVYKFCDIGLLLGAWLSHLLWHDTQLFSVLSAPETRNHLLLIDPRELLLLSVMILLAAAGKSAQWPFSFWLSRAMEGPTPSSAIYYGALSVHAGILLLHRMHPIWSATEYGPWIVGTLGCVTAVTCTGISRVQSNVKGQIAYSSAANVGIIFLEMALNLKQLAMIHLVANACLRCYQLLISPSTLAYRLKLQGSIDFALRPLGRTIEGWLPLKLSRMLYVFCLNDGYLEGIVYGLIWNPIRRVGSFLHRFDCMVYWLVFPSILISVGILRVTVSEGIREGISVFAAALTIGLSTMAFAEQKSAIRAWNTASLSAMLAGMSVLVLNPSTGSDIAFYSSGILFFWILGLQSLLFMNDGQGGLSLNRYSGMSLIAPGGAVILFVSFLGVSGFPISPTYIGQDLLLHHASSEFIWMVMTLSVAIVINGVSLARVYTKVCMGDPTKRKKSEFAYAP